MKQKITISIDDNLVQQIPRGNRSQWVEEAIQHKLWHDAHGKNALVKTQLWDQLQSLQQHYQIRWDRVIEDPSAIYIYGWLTNDKHERGDFVLFILDLLRNEYSVLTSSVDLSHQLSASFSENTDCIKFTTYFKEQLMKITKQ